MIHFLATYIGFLLELVMAIFAMTFLVGFGVFVYKLIFKRGEKK